MKALGEDHFWDYCDTRKILVREAQLEQPGYSIVIEGQRYIFVHDELRGMDRLFTLYHELAHHWLHPPRIHFFRGWNQTTESEANLVATCALIPRTRIIHWCPSEIAAEGFPDWLIKLRQEVLEYWDI